MFSTTNKGLQQKISSTFQHLFNALSPKSDRCMLCRNDSRRSPQPQASTIHANPPHQQSSSISIVQHPPNIESRPTIQLPPKIETRPTIQLPPTIVVCSSCMEQIPWIQHIYCSTCGRHEDCHDCKRRQNSYFVCNRSSVQYNPLMKEWLAQYKYRKNERLEPLMIQMIIQAYRLLNCHLIRISKKIDCVTYIPLSEERMEERGFNQAERLAEGLANHLQLPLISLLQRTRHTHKQSYKSRAERLLDLEGAFTIDSMGFQQLSRILSQQTSQLHISIPTNSPRQGDRPQLNLLLVDDVYTTGSTLNQCAKVLKSALRADVYGLTWAR